MKAVKALFTIFTLPIMLVVKACGLVFTVPAKALSRKKAK